MPPRARSRQGSEPRRPPSIAWMRSFHSFQACFSAAIETAILRPRGHRMNDSAVLLANGNLRIKRTLHGLMTYNINDVYIGRSLDLYGEYSAGEATLFAQLAPAGSVAVDVGANIG